MLAAKVRVVRQAHLETWDCLEFRVNQENKEERVTREISDKEANQAMQVAMATQVTEARQVYLDRLQ